MRYSHIKPLIFRLDPEFAHEQTIFALRLAQRVPLAQRLLEAFFYYEDPILAVSCAGMSMINPFGMAAGFDKRAELVPGLAALGFGHIEIGTVTPQPQSGNDRPRMFRLPEDAAVINRMGFNSPGMNVAMRQLAVGRAAAQTMARMPKIGVNIGKNKLTPNEQATDDYVRAFDLLAPLGDYVTVNISSPNTPGLRALHHRAALEELAGALAERNRSLAVPRPIFVKVSPDETPEQLDSVVAAAQMAGMSGIIAGNTTLARHGLASKAQHEQGGLSGRPLAAQARQTIRHIYRATSGTMPIIGVGGVMSAEDAYHHIRAGASLVQVYTGLVYHGPGLVKTLKQQLAALLRRDGFSSVGEAVGVAR